MPDPASPNTETIRLWNEVLAPKFTRHRRILVDSYRAHSNPALARHPVRPGDGVLDVGCGFGETTIQLAQAAGPTGGALGVDVCEPFLAVARADAARAGVAAARFRAVDAQVEPFDESFDLVFSRFGTMFFDSPVAAMANLRRATRPGGRLLMVVWRRIEDNDWVAIPKEVARRHLPPPPGQPPPPGGPGAFSMTDADKVRAILTQAGWSGVGLERIDADVSAGDSLEEAVAFDVALGPAGQIVREAGELGAARLPAIEADLATRLRPFVTPRGVMMGSSSWCVTATNPR